MKNVSELEKYFILNEFEDGWGMEDIQCEEQMYDYCLEALFIPDEKIEELNIDENYNLEIYLHNLELDDVAEDWYVNLVKSSIEGKK